MTAWLGRGASTIWAATSTSVQRSRDGGVTWVKQFAVS
jgi:hypothetical protein